MPERLNVIGFYLMPANRQATAHPTATQAVLSQQAAHPQACSSTSRPLAPVAESKRLEAWLPVETATKLPALAAQGDPVILWPLRIQPKLVAKPGHHLRQSGLAIA